MTRLLASISNLAEAHIALQAPIGILDMKDPAQGALGALDKNTMSEIVKFASGNCTTSATIGDLPADADMVLEKIQTTAALGVDYIKIGMFGEDWLLKCLPALKTIATQVNLVGVLFAEHFADLSGPCHLLKAAAFSGAMIDTANKKNGSVRTIKSDDELSEFVRTAHDNGLLCGIAGSLKYADIKPLTTIAPDYLGFRTALCENHQRQGKLSATKIQEIAEHLYATA
ncbi:MAG: hypothetical protein F4Y58_03450 [Gammaproteobacteria bacterium]|nr:hypothetical protein [Gammaproteobacteria bacterium]